MLKKILVASGTSTNKMNFATETIAQMCTAKGVAVEVWARNIYEVDIANERPDVIVMIGPNRFDTDIPIVSGMSFITKMGMEQTVDEILSKLK